MVGVVGGKEQPNTECGPAVDRVAVVVGGEEQLLNGVVVGGSRAQKGRVAMAGLCVKKRGI